MVPPVLQPNSAINVHIPEQGRNSWPFLAVRVHKICTSYCRYVGSSCGRCPLTLFRGRLLGLQVIGRKRTEEFLLALLKKAFPFLT